MNQPYLGQKVSELRQLKGLTQEQLAEKCEVSTRTIQRIESGEVDPLIPVVTEEIARGLGIDPNDFWNQIDAVMVDYFD
jgi:transcriptional regulator with XRE-family HTH domain